MPTPTSEAMIASPATNMTSVMTRARATQGATSMARSMVDSRGERKMESTDRITRPQTTGFGTVGRRSIHRVSGSVAEGPTADAVGSIS